MNEIEQPHVGTWYYSKRPTNSTEILWNFDCQIMERVKTDEVLGCPRTLVDDLRRKDKWLRLYTARCPERKFAKAVSHHLTKKGGLNAEISSAAYISMQHKIVNMLDPQSHHNPLSHMVFFQWHTQYGPTMKHQHCETVYAKVLFQLLFFELVQSLRIISILPIFKLAGLTKVWQWCT